MTEIVKKRPVSVAKIEDGLKKVENKLFQECQEVVHSAISHTFDLNPETPNEFPNSWLDEEARGEVTMEELRKRMRIAKAAWMPPKEAPVALQMAAKVLSGMQKAAAMSNAPKSLNLTMVSISAPGQEIPVFPEKEIKHE